MAKSVGGLVGSAIAAKMRTGTDGSLVTDGGIAASFPGGPLVLGLSDQRVLGWSWSKLTGKPKDLRVAIAREDLAEVQVEKKTAASTFVLVFADGTAKAYEAPRVNNNPDELVAAFRS